MKINVFRQSSIRLEDGVVIYFDPFRIKEKLHDADYIFITHDHYDHYDEEAIRNVAKETTKLIVPKCLEKVSSFVVSPNEEYDLEDLTFKCIPAYNIDKSFHPKEMGYVGYLVKINKQSYYIMGDTDVTDEALNVRCDCLFIPIGGKYTMNLEEAVKYVNEVKPKKVIPIHYGSIVGDISLGEEFKRLIDKDIEVELYIKEEKL